jgi:CheY-like chemotaxis protein
MTPIADTAIDVLVIDDDDVATESVIRGLRKSPVRLNCLTAEDGLAGLKVLRGEHGEKSSRPPRLVLLDLNMPRMDGHEFLKALREDAALHDTVVFVLTTSNRDADRTLAYRENIAGYLVKSEVGPQFSKLTALLAAYADAVSLPLH